MQLRGKAMVLVPNVRLWLSLLSTQTILRHDYGPARTPFRTPLRRFRARRTCARLPFCTNRFKNSRFKSAPCSPYISLHTVVPFRLSGGQAAGRGGLGRVL